MTRIAFSTRRGLFSAVIRALTFSRWSHVVLIHGDHVIEATFPRVRMIGRSEWEVEQKRFELGPEVPYSAWIFARNQLGCRYDFGALLGIAFRKKWDAPGQWFCSELVAAAIGERRQLFRDDISRVTPEMLYRLHPSIYEAA